MWDMVLTISKDKQFYARATIAREIDVALAQARDFAARFPESEGFRVTLYRWENTGTPVDFVDRSG